MPPSRTSFGVVQFGAIGSSPMDDDITYVPTWVGFLYLAVVLDAFSRRIVGWAMGNDLKTQIVLPSRQRAVHAPAG